MPYPRCSHGNMAKEVLVDNLTRVERSKQMSLIRSRDTKPELQIRRLVHGLGYRYRLHRTDLPGRPDLVFPSKMKVIFIHGCFWHGHKCKLGRIPKSNVEYWTKKISVNKKRDRMNIEHLCALGWKSLILWECRLKNNSRLATRIRRFLDS